MMYFRFFSKTVNLVALYGFQRAVFFYILSYIIMPLIRPESQRIIAFSDLHADLEALIICLRDCAKVIQKQDKYAFAPHEPDADLYHQLNLPSVRDKTYSRHLHYQWVGGSTIIVVVGDLIDGAREDDSAKKQVRGKVEEVAYYPQVEIKLLHFINAMNEQAKKHDGGIIKVLGNHDYENFKGNHEMIESYIFTPDRKNPRYYQHEDGRWESRTTFFQFGHKGYELYQATLGMYMFLVINNTIFVHGQLPSKEWLDKGVDLSHIERINQMLRVPYTEKVGKALEKEDELIETILWNRTYGDVDERDEKDEATFLASVQADIKQCCGGEKHMRVLIGHCQQHTVHQNPEVRTTLGHLCHRDPTIEVYDNVTLYRGLPDATCVKENKTFGIVTEGVFPKQQRLCQPQLVKLDVGMGRGQEYMNDYRALQSGEMLEIDFFRPRAPQLIEIVGPRLSIHRSTMWNMGVHMKRDTYQSMHKSYPSIYPQHTDL